MDLAKNLIVIMIKFLPYVERNPMWPKVLVYLCLGGFHRNAVSGVTEELCGRVCMVTSVEHFGGGGTYSARQNCTQNVQIAPSEVPNRSSNGHDRALLRW